MSEHLDPWDRALLSAMSSGDEAGLLTLEQLAAQSGVSQTLLEVLEREELLLPRKHQPEPLYDPHDADAIRAGLEVVGAGLPLGELLDLARKMDEAMRPIAAAAVDMFANFVRDSVEANAASEEEASEQLVEAFRTMLPAAADLVEHHFRRLVISAALDRIQSG